jgi:V/A-type H+-transporting ATPase subunit D
MELIRLRRRLTIAVRGHKLLQDKLEELMRRFLALLKDIDTAKSDFQKNTQSIIKDLLYCRIVTPKIVFEEILLQIHAYIKVSSATTRIMNIAVPNFDAEEVKIDKVYDFFKAPAQLDIVVAQAKGYILSLLKLAELLKSLDILSYEIERTRRRVNALEYMLIPSIKETIRYITQKLNELERANLVRLMRVKEIVRSH